MIQIRKYKELLKRLKSSKKNNKASHSKTILKRFPEVAMDVPSISSTVGARFSSSVP